MIILWRGKIVSNPRGLSILPAFRLWAASRSINIASILTDSAPKVIAARLRVDLATLKAIEGNSTTLVDSKNLYLSESTSGAAVMLLY